MIWTNEGSLERYESKEDDCEEKLQRNSFSTPGYRTEHRFQQILRTQKATASRDALAEVDKELNEHSSEKHFCLLTFTRFREPAYQCKLIVCVCAMWHSETLLCVCLVISDSGHASK